MSSRDFTMTGRVAWSREYWHERAAVSEGLCPRHHTALTAIELPPGVSGGLCEPCARYWGACPETEQVGWRLAEAGPVGGDEDWLRVPGL